MKEVILDLIKKRELSIDTCEQLKKDSKTLIYNIYLDEKEFGIPFTLIDERAEEFVTTKIVEELYNDELIDDDDRDYYYNDVLNKMECEYMSSIGYKGTFYDHDEGYFSKLPEAQKAYNKLLEELDKKGVNYKISKSWNAGVLPSIYIEKGNETFRIANHYNSDNEEWEANKFEKNKIYTTEDYINYKETILEDLKKFLESVE